MLQLSSGSLRDASRCVNSVLAPLFIGTQIYRCETRSRLSFTALNYVTRRYALMLRNEDIRFSIYCKLSRNPAQHFNYKILCSIIFLNIYDLIYIFKNCFTQIYILFLYISYLISIYFIYIIIYIFNFFEYIYK